MAAAAAVAVSGGHWRRLRTLGRGASGAVVSLASDAASGELFAVKSAGARDAATTLRREQALLAGLSSPHVVRCVGGGEGAEEGSYNLFLEYAPGGSLADEVARNGGSLEERAIRGYAADVLRALAYLHGRCSVVHGDVKARNVLIGADGRAKLADFGCARAFGSAGPIGGTPAFMAPEVARGEDQGPAADVWALGCTVIEMATGRAPWSDMGDDDVLAAVHRIGYTDAVPEVPFWLSADAEDFLACCFARDAADRWTAAQLLEHPFVAFADHDDKAPRRASPKSTLDAAFWESESESDDDDADEVSSGNASERIKSLASSPCGLPDWDSEDGWIDVLGEQQQQQQEVAEAACGAAVQVSRCAPGKVSSALAVPAGEMAVGGGGLPSDDELEADDVPFGGGDDVPAAADASVERQEKHYLSSHCHVVALSCQLVPCNLVINAIKLWVPTNFRCAALFDSPVMIPCSCLIFHRYTRDRPRSASHATLARA